jgi:hypothetical protein
MKLVLLLFILLSLNLNAETEKSYGWDISNTSFNIGGYLDMSYDDTRVDDFLFNDIAMIISGRQDRFDFLAEVELSHISLDGKSYQSGDIDFNVERLQLSYTFNDEQSLRVGRFNSDVGYWNQAPIPILQDTTTKPHFVGKLFPRATTGVLFQQNINNENLVSFTFQNNDDIAHQENTVDIDKHLGFSYLGNYEDFSWRFSTGRYRDTNAEEFHYTGIGSDYDVDEFSLQGELFFQKSKASKKKPYSGYVQSTWHVADEQDAVLRFEGYDDKVLKVEENIYLLGYVYRPTSNISMKGEYIHHSKLPLNRFVYSLSVLF